MAFDPIVSITKHIFGNNRNHCIYKNIDYIYKFNYTI